MADKQTKVNMVSSQSWRDHFKVDQDALEAFWEEFSQNSPLRASEMNPSDAGNSIEFVLWCIQQGRFSEDAFVQWQSEHLEIPVVRHAYFEAPVDTAFWDRVKEIHPWNATCMPLAEWDDILLVAVANPTAQELSLSKRHRVVLASPTHLRDYFERVDQSAVSKISLPAPEAVPESIAEATPALKDEGSAPTSAPFEIKPPATKAEKSTAPVAPVASPAVDDGDPFAALSRELGALTNEAEATQEPTHGSSDAPEGLVLPDGLILPEGLDFGALGNAASAEAQSLTTEADSTLTASGEDSVNFDAHAGAPEGFNIASEQAEDSVVEGGTLVHNFETGKDEVVAKPHLENDSADPVKPASPPPPPLNLESAQEEAPAMASAAETKLEPATPSAEAASKNTAAPEAVAAATAFEDSDDPLASLVMQQPVASTETDTNKPGMNAGIPELPFSIPRHESDEDVANPVAATPTKNPEAQKTGRVRKPLFAPVDDAATPSSPIPKPTAPPKSGTLSHSAFEPRSSKGAGFDATQAVSIKNDDVDKDHQQDTQIGSKTGTFAGTQTRSRRLENTPVTSMLGNGNQAIQQERPGGNPAYLNKSIAIGKLDPIHLDQCRSIDEAGAQAILQACNIYECAMILLFRGGDLVPWKWNDLFLSVRGDKPEPVDLVEPSIFKVVFRTAKPYHGYLVTSEVNQKFLNEFYRGMLPKHATITPLMIDGRMGGMVLGFTNSKIDYRQSLRLMERLTFDLARVFKSLRGTMSKAS